MKKLSDSFEPWRSHKSTEQGVSARRYAFLISSNLRVPDLRVDAGIWNRIVRGLPRDYMLPDETLLNKMAQRVKERRKADEVSRDT